MLGVDWCKRRGLCAPLPVQSECKSDRKSRYTLLSTTYQGVVCVLLLPPLPQPLFSPAPAVEKGNSTLISRCCWSNTLGKVLQQAIMQPGRKWTESISSLVSCPQLLRFLDGKSQANYGRLAPIIVMVAA